MYGRVLPPEEMIKDPYRHARAQGFRSGLEVAVARQLKEAGVPYAYEELTIPWKLSELRKYTPDFLLPNGIIIETKGRFLTSDRKKVRLVKEQYPDLDIRLVFSNQNQTISKQSRTTYAVMAKRMGIPWAARLIPKEWLDEPKNVASIRAIKALGVKGVK